MASEDPAEGVVTAYTNLVGAQQLQACIPGDAALATRVNGELVERAEPVVATYSPALRISEVLQYRVSHQEIQAQCKKIVTVDNALPWVETAFWAKPDGSAVITTAPNWPEAREFHTKAINVQVLLDGAALAVSAEFDVVSEVFAQVSDLINWAMHRQAWSIPPGGDANGFTSFYGIAQADTRVVDPPAGSGAPIDIRSLICLSNMLPRASAHPDQLTLVLAPAQYDEMLAKAATSGDAVFRQDPVNGRLVFYQLGIATYREDNLADGNAVAILCDRAVLPPEKRLQVPVRGSAGVTVVSHAAGVTLKSVDASSGSDDQKIATFSADFALVSPQADAIAWMENFG